MRATDTHSYDGKLLERKKEMQKHLEKASSCTKNDKLEMFAKLISVLKTKPCFSQQGFSNFSTIIKDFELDNSSPNYDPTNHLFAIDILYLCAQICFSATEDVRDEISILLNIQFEEMSSGMCPQGRTTRLMQVLLSFSEFL